MEEILSIFKNDAFSATSLDRVARTVPYVPSYLGDLNIFGGPGVDRPIRTKSVEVFSSNGIINMVPTTERGAPDPLITRGAADLRTLYTYRLSQRDRLYASEIQDLISMPLGSPQQLRGMAEEIAERSQTLRQNNEYTHESHRLGALQGKILDADGVTVVRNFWTEFGVAEPAEIFFDFATIAANALQQFIEDNILRPLTRALQGRANPGTRIHALVGDAFWSKLINHVDVRESYKLAAAQNGALGAAMLNNRLGQANNGRGTAWGEFTWGGVTWTNYMGTVNSEIAIGSEKARFFPVGATDVFRTYWSPGERMVDVNTRGQKAYLILQVDPRENMREYIDLYFRNYPLYACIFPGGLLKGRSA
jgi:hypothetical protein